MTEAEMVQVQLPMWVIDQIRADLRLTSGTWAVIEECVERPVAFADQVLPCDVRLPPGTVFAKGSKLSGLLLAMNQRENGSAINTTFQ
ncbi:hypothetical protein [Pseudomonas folii]|uniref:Flagellar motor switch protein FliN-like C-terminal domain-containing protein n=1 Tax=Pseudomonas folii TaxID=2762593 RepID=A0ABR7ATS5_9PSED|nr:hypothetical protein [Pseudomonas folii]MBC3948306.1 hypothetical protein [Pseudomonas folii]